MLFRSLTEVTGVKFEILSSTLNKRLGKDVYGEVMNDFKSGEPPDIYSKNNKFIIPLNFLNYKDFRKLGLGSEVGGVSTGGKLPFDNPERPTYRGNDISFPTTTKAWWNWMVPPKPIIEHEILHQLGKTGEHSGNPFNILFPYLLPGQKISENDIKEIRKNFTPSTDTHMSRRPWYKQNNPKMYHSGGVVQGAYGQEVLAMLQGGEVVLPKELGRRTNYQTSSSILDSVTKNLNSSFNVTINVPNTNASPQEIAQVVMRTIKYEQGRAYTSGRVV